MPPAPPGGTGGGIASTGLGDLGQDRAHDPIRHPARLGRAHDAGHLPRLRPRHRARQVRGPGRGGRPPRAAARLLEEYEAQCARNRELAAGLDLDTPSKRTISTGEPVTLRWILFHMVEETARHNGHIDILRELADGVTGT